VKIDGCAQPPGLGIVVLPFDRVDAEVRFFRLEQTLECINDGNLRIGRVCGDRCRDRPNG
jgi:hypothetical protein